MRTHDCIFVRPHRGAESRVLPPGGRKERTPLFGRAPRRLGGNCGTPTAHGHDCARVVESFLQTPVVIGDAAAMMRETPLSGLTSDKRAVTGLRRLTVPKRVSGSPRTRASCSHLAGRLIFPVVATC